LKKQVQLINIKLYN